MRWYTTALDAPDDMLVVYDGEKICFEVGTTAGKEELRGNLPGMRIARSIPEAMSRIRSAWVWVAFECELEYEIADLSRKEGE